MKILMKVLTLSSIACISIASAAEGDPIVEGGDARLNNITAEARIYQHDGFGAQWALDTGSDGLWFVPKEPVNGTYNAPFKVRNEAAANTLVIGTNDDTNVTNGYVGIGTDTPTSPLDVQWSGDNTARDGTKYMDSLSADNSASGKTSDAGFAIENKREGFKWEFRTYEAAEGFTATKAGTGGGEFIVENTTNDYHNAKMVVGGVTVFENGHLVTASSRKLKTAIEPLDTQAALDAFRKLQPVSYEYKAYKGDKVVGFIAEDIPDLVAMPSRKAFDSAEVVAVLTKVVQEQDKKIVQQAKKIEELEKMKEKVTKLGSLIQNTLSVR
jgi:hypothetical protein